MKDVSDTRIPPSNNESEQAVLGACLKGGRPVIEKSMAWIRDVEAFYYDENQKIWKILVSMYKSNMAIDVVTVSAQHKEIYDEANAFFITGLYSDTVTTANVESYARIVWEKHIQRLIGKASYGLYKNSYKNYDKTMDILLNHRRLTEELISLAPELKTLTCVSILAMFNI